ncbi:MAG: MFS transporter, partial [Bradyrhizobium sp.]|nr:MFS transporter [Bradyrhizobium sp.]
GALLEMDGILGFKGWQWLFLIEALPAVLLGFVVLGYMTDRPEQARWLADDERDWLVRTMNAELASKAATASHSIWRGLADIRVLALALVYFGTSAGLYTLGVWAPQIIKQFGLSSFAVGFLNAVPPTIAVVVMILWARHSDRTAERTWHVVLACVVAAVGLWLAGLSTSVAAVLAALTLVNVGISSSKPPLWSMPTMFLSGSAAAAGIATINSIGNIVTSGSGSDGILARSTSFGQLSSISSNGNLTASGDGSYAIHAITSSIGNTTVTNLGGTISGGPGAGAGIYLQGGNANVLTNYGTVTSAAGTAGSAILGDTGNIVVNNSGTILGSVNLGRGTNSFNNLAG